MMGEMKPEAVARIIDPGAMWNLNGVPDLKLGWGSRVRQKEALGKAVEIIALLARTPPTTQGGEGDSSGSAAETASVGQAAHQQSAVRHALGFFASVIKSGEDWTEHCQQAYEAALRELPLVSGSPLEVSSASTSQADLETSGAAEGRVSAHPFAETFARIIDPRAWRAYDAIEASNKHLAFSQQNAFLVNPSLDAANEIIGHLAAAPPAPASDHVGEMAEALTMTGCKDAADLIDMANVGSSLLGEIAALVKGEGPFKGWMPNNDPAEIVFDLVNHYEDALRAAAPPSPDHAALVGEAVRAVIAASNNMTTGVRMNDEARSRLAAALHPSAEGGEYSLCNSVEPEQVTAQSAVIKGGAE